jgi:hypothetical protein
MRPVKGVDYGAAPWVSGTPTTVREGLLMFAAQLKALRQPQVIQEALQKAEQLLKASLPK